MLFVQFEDEIRNQLNDPAHVFEHRIPEKGTWISKIKESVFCILSPS